MKIARDVMLVLFVLATLPAAGWCQAGGTSAAAVGETPRIIDNFSGGAIDRTKWDILNDKAGKDVFTQSGNRLHVSVTAGSGALRSTKTVGPGFYTMRFEDYSSSNMEEPGSHKGAFIGLVLGPKDNFVRIMRCQNGRRSPSRGEDPVVGVFEANYIDKAKGGVQVFISRTKATAGRLGLYFDGSKVIFYYNPDVRSDKGWQVMKQSGGKDLQWEPHWTEPPTLSVSTSDPSGTTTGCVIDVEYRLAPPEVGAKP